MKFCTNCGAQLADDAAFCTQCGAPAAVAGETVVPDAPTVLFTEPESQKTPVQETQPMSNNYAQGAQPAPESFTQGTQQSFNQPNTNYDYNQNNGYVPNNGNVAPNPTTYAPYGSNPQGGWVAPALKLPTNRALWKYILFSIITLGIYSIVVMSKVSSHINLIASRYDGLKTMHYCLVFFIFSWLTLGIVPLVWYHKMSGRIGRELQRRGIGYSFGARHFWLWGILGACIIVGPFIYTHKLLKSMNKLSEDYNIRG